MVADAINRYRLNDVSSDPELAQAVKNSAGTLYSGDLDDSGSLAFD